MSSLFSGIDVIGASGVTVANGEKIAETAASGASDAQDIMAAIAGTAINAEATGDIRMASGTRWQHLEPAQSSAVL